MLLSEIDTGRFEKFCYHNLNLSSYFGPDFISKPTCREKLFFEACVYTLEFDAVNADLDRTNCRNLAGKTGFAEFEPTVFG